jgi:hypothetical protein
LETNVNSQQLYVFAVNSKAPSPSANALNTCIHLFHNIPSIESCLAGEQTVYTQSDINIHRTEKSALKQTTVHSSVAYYIHAFSHTHAEKHIKVVMVNIGYPKQRNFAVFVSLMAERLFFRYQGYVRFQMSGEKPGPLPLSPPQIPH